MARDARAEPTSMARAIARRLLNAAFAGLILASLLGSDADAKVFGAETFTLANGLQVVVVTNRAAPVVTHQVWYKVGSADEPKGKSGIAHFLEHLMFKGTRTLAPGEFSKLIARHGGRENAFTSWDYTGYFQTIARDRLDLVMRHEADRMTNLVLTDAVVDPERSVILEERRQRTDNVPEALLAEQARAALYLHHPYRIPIIGWFHEMQGLTRTDAQDFYRTHYAPNNAVLIVAGDVDAGEVRKLAETHYGPIAARPVPPRVRPAEPPHVAARRVMHESARVRQASWRRTYLAPSYNRGIQEPDAKVGPEHAYALQVLAEVLGGGSSSRLHRSLVIERKLATGAGAGYGATDFDLSDFGISASPRPASGARDEDPALADPRRAVEAIERAVDDVIAALLERGVTDDEVGRAKTRMVDAAAFARDGSSTAVRAIGSTLMTGGTVDDVESWPDRIDAVTPAQVNAAARAVLVLKRSVTSILLPKPTS
ncbi:MAG: insulinase family protein [Alphaproteobacteria bacterium]|nr:insulinase family protein [Alphaproteobacteria bacterium]